MKIVIHPDYRRFSAFLRTLPERFDREGTTIYKARNEIKVFEVEGVKLNVKQFKVPHFINRVAYTFFRPSKVLRAFTYALKVQALGGDTPPPVGYIQFKKGGLLHRSYFISLQYDYEPMYEPGRRPLAENADLFAAMARYTAGLHERGIYHADYSPGNILYKRTPEGIKFCLVDINRMYFGPVSVKRGCANFARLWGGEDAFRLIARSYAEARGADPEACLKWVLEAREEFWKRYRRRHEVPFAY